MLLAFAPCSGQTSFYNSVKKEVDQRFAEIDAKIAENKAKNPDYSEYYKNLPVKVEQVSDFSVPDVEWNIAEKYPKIDRSGKKLCTKIIQKAIDDLSKKGGGNIKAKAGLKIQKERFCILGQTAQNILIYTSKAFTKMKLKATKSRASKDRIFLV